jgi:hypothetical protein
LEDRVVVSEADDREVVLWITGELLDVVRRRRRDGDHASALADHPRHQAFDVEHTGRVVLALDVKRRQVVDNGYRRDRRERNQAAIPGGQIEYFDTGAAGGKRQGGGVPQQRQGGPVPAVGDAVQGEILGRVLSQKRKDLHVLFSHPHVPLVFGAGRQHVLHHVDHVSSDARQASVAGKQTDADRAAGGRTWGVGRFGRR